MDSAGFDDCVKEGLNELTPYFQSGTYIHIYNQQKLRKLIQQNYVCKLKVKAVF